MEKDEKERQLHSDLFYVDLVEAKLNKFDIKKCVKITLKEIALMSDIFFDDFTSLLFYDFKECCDLVGNFLISFEGETQEIFSYEDLFLRFNPELRQKREVSYGKEHSSC